WVHRPLPVDGPPIRPASSCSAAPGTCSEHLLSCYRSVLLEDGAAASVHHVHLFRGHAHARDAAGDGIDLRLPAAPRRLLQAGRHVRMEHLSVVPRAGAAFGILAFFPMAAAGMGRTPRDRNLAAVPID